MCLWDKGYVGGSFEGFLVEEFVSFWGSCFSGECVFRYVRFLVSVFGVRVVSLVKFFVDVSFVFRIRGIIWIIRM